MHAIDGKVFEYLRILHRQNGQPFDDGDLRDMVQRHLDSARAVLTNDTLERLGHAQLASMIGTANHYSQLLGTLLMEALRAGSQQAPGLCRELKRRQDAYEYRRRRARLRLV